MFSAMSSGGYSHNAQQFVTGSHRGGGFQLLMQKRPNPSQAQRPQSMSPVQQAAPPSQNSFGQQSDTPMMPSAAGPGIRQGSCVQDERVVNRPQLRQEAAPPSQLPDAVADACGWRERLWHCVHFGDFLGCLVGQGRKKQASPTLGQRRWQRS